MKNKKPDDTGSPDDKGPDDHVVPVPRSAGGGPNESLDHKKHTITVRKLVAETGPALKLGVEDDDGG